MCSASLNFLLSQLFSNTYIGETGQSLSIRLKEQYREETLIMYMATQPCIISNGKMLRYLNSKKNWLKRKSKSHGFLFAEASLLQPLSPVCTPEDYGCILNPLVGGVLKQLYYTILKILKFIMKSY